MCMLLLSIHHFLHVDSQHVYIRPDFAVHSAKRQGIYNSGFAEISDLVSCLELLKTEAKH